jgi:dipeptidyl aminopeptidase/acylaminoacyl peptidase
MIQFDTETKSIAKLSETKFKNENILERYDFQEAIVKNWEDFRNEINLPECFLIGSEIKPHDSVNNAIDMLAFDSNSNRLIVIEIKRDKNKLQLLQAVSYAAMLSEWDKEKLKSVVQDNSSSLSEDLMSAIEAEEPLSKHVKILLLAEKYDPEVIISSQWLHDQYGLDINAYAVKAIKFDGKLILDIEQRYPLKELSEMYDLRIKKQPISTTNVNISWDDLLPKFKFSFAKEALELCRNEKGGDPQRRRFVSFRSNIDGLAWIIVGFRTNYLNLYIKGKVDDPERFFQSKISPGVEFSEWAEGYSLNQ